MLRGVRRFGRRELRIETFGTLKQPPNVSIKNSNFVLTKTSVPQAKHELSLWLRGDNLSGRFAQSALDAGSTEHRRSARAQSRTIGCVIYGIIQAPTPDQSIGLGGAAAFVRKRRPLVAQIGRDLRRRPLLHDYCNGRVTSGVRNAIAALT